MRVTILGTRGNIDASAPGHARHAGVLVDRRLLFDVGEASYLDYRPTDVFITHLHPDHAVPGLAGWDGISFHVPERTSVLPDARVVAAPVRIGRYRIVPVPVVHSQRVQSRGYVVEHGGHSFFYSSDMITIERRYRALLRGVGVVITDGSYLRRGGLVRIDSGSGRRYGHAGIPDLVELFRAYTPCIIVSHFGSWFYKDVPASVRRIEALGDGVRVVAAHDGLDFEV